MKLRVLNKHEINEKCAHTKGHHFKLFLVAVQAFKNLLMPCPFALILFVPPLRRLLDKALDGTIPNFIHKWTSNFVALYITSVFFVLAQIGSFIYQQTFIYNFIM